jgi:hypothetical protein
VFNALGEVLGPGFEYPTDDDDPDTGAEYPTEVPDTGGGSGYINL